MNLGKWLEQQHSLAEQLDVMLSICKSVVGSHQGGSAAGVALAPPRMEVDSGGNLHLMGGSIGTPTEYAAPELGEGDDPTPSADVFAVGVIYYEILTGRHPFASGGGFDRNTDPTPLRDARSDLPSDVADAIQACLDKDPDWRPKDLEYLLSVLEKAAEEGPKPSVSRTPTIKPTVKRRTMRPKMTPGSNPPQVKRPASQLPTAPRATAKPPTARLKSTSSGTGSNIGYVLAALLVLALGGAGAYFALQSAGVIGEGQQTADEPTASEADAGTEATPAPTPRPAPRTARAAPPPTTAAAAPTPAVQATPPPVSEPARETVAAAAPTPTPVPRATPAPAPTPAPAATPAETAGPAEPAVITTLSPPNLKRGAKTIVDVRGSGFVAHHQARFMRGRKTADGLKIVGSKFASPDLLQLLIEVDAKAPTGEYMIQVFAPGVGASNVHRFEITK